MNQYQNSPAVGLDVGTSRIVIAQQAEVDGSHGIQYRSQLNAFAALPYTRITANVLERESVPHATLGGEIIVHGNESEKFANLLNAEIRRPMSQGVLDPKEPESLRVMQEILGNLLRRAMPEHMGDRKLCFTVPAAPIGAEASLTYHEATVKQILNELGYPAVAINEGLAVVYSELESSNYTGIGISCGGGLCNVCLAYLSVPVVSFSIPKAGDFIDSNASVVTGERANRIRMSKEDSFHFNGFFADKIHQVLGVYYDDMIRSLVKSLKDAFARTKGIPQFARPIPLVLSGGTALPPGFRDRFEKLLREQEFPIALSEIRMAGNPLHATAKGALVYALSELA